MTVLERELEWRRENERFAFFTPNGKQEEFVRLAGAGADSVYILSAANGIGKTTLVVNLMAHLVFGPQNNFFDVPLFRNWPYPKRIRYITDQKIVEESGPFPTELKKWWPKGKYSASKLGRNYFCQYTVGEWVIDVMTYEQDLSQFEGGTFGAIIFDEPPKESIWAASVARLRLGGLIFAFMTPLVEAGWFFDKVVPNHPNSIVYASMEDACKTHGVRGHLEHEHIERMIREMSPDEIEARAHGKAMYLKGLVFKGFNYKVHVLKEPVQPPLHSTLYNVVDPHTDKPFFAIWAWPHKNGDIYITDEHPNEDFFRMRNCQWDRNDYKRMYEAKEHGYTVRRIIDRHFGEIRSAAYKKTLREELAEIGLHYEPSYQAEHEIDTGVLKVREFLKYDPTREMTSINRPRLYINPHCLNTIRAFSRWSTDAKTGKYQDDYKDPMDCVRYLLMANPTPSEPLPPYQPRKLYG
ncbi:MAG TPA: terminase family protein [Sphingomicrobium sp.]|nr:terminase family protein [Sphingomicrobium sp.]